MVIPDLGSKDGRYVKLLVDVDLTKPLIRGISIRFEDDRRWVVFKFEQLPQFCVYCGLIGHGEKNCERKIKDAKNEKLSEGQYGEWLKASDWRLSSRGRGIGTTKLNERKVLSQPEGESAGHEKDTSSVPGRGSLKDTRCEEEGAIVHSEGRIAEGKDKENVSVRVGTGRDISSKMDIGIETKAGVVEDKRGFEGGATARKMRMTEGEGLWVLREIDQNIAIPKGDFIDKNTKRGTWRRGESDKRQCGTIDQGVELDIVINRKLKPSKRGLS